MPFLRSGILKALLSLEWQLAGEGKERRDDVNIHMRKALKRGIESGEGKWCVKYCRLICPFPGKFRMAGVGARFFKLADPKKAAKEGEATKPKNAANDLTFVVKPKKAKPAAAKAKKPAATAKTNA